jgi:hypothetical protein
MYVYLSDFDYFLVMVKIFKKYSYIKKMKITHKKYHAILLKKLHDIKQEIIKFRERNYEC